MSKKNERKAIRIVENSVGNQIQKRNEAIALKRFLKSDLDVRPNIGPGQNKSTAYARMLRAGAKAVDYGSYRMRGNPGRFPPVDGPRRGPVQVQDALAPVAIGSSVHGSFIRHTGKPQPNTDITGSGGANDGTRVEFQDLSPIVINSDGISSQKALLYSATNYGGVQLGPTVISARLAQMSVLYSYYAFRELEITFVPLVATTATGDVALAVDMGINQTAGSLITGITQTQVLQHAVTGATNVWKPMVLRYRFAGSKLWLTSTTNQTGPACYQMILWGAFGGTVSTATQGNIYMKGICDFYKTSEILSSPSLQEDAIWSRYFSLQYHLYQLKLDAEVLDFKDFCERYGDQIKLRERKKILHPKPITLVAYDPFECKEPTERKVPEGKK